MPDSLIVVTVEGMERIVAKLAKLPDAIADDGVEAGNKFLLGKLQNAAPPSNYVTRKAAYGVSFFTAKQRRWFFASLKDGSIDVPYKRTGGMLKSWQMVGTGRLSFLANEAPGAHYVIGDGQSRHEALVGWKKYGATLKAQTSGIMHAFAGAVKKAIRRVGL